MDRRIEEIIQENHKMETDRRKDINIKIDNAVKIIKHRNNQDLNEIIVKLSLLNDKEIASIFKIIKGLK
jgi:TATA-box binding protein (TBP) (component of TFIID and TFIIIB)